MKRAFRSGFVVALLGAAGCIAVSCGGDDTTDTGLTAGSAGTGGTSGTAGAQTGGSAGTGGSSIQTGGSSGSGGNGGSTGTAGSGGTAGSAGSGGTAGTGGTSTEAGTKDAANEATTEASASDAKEASTSDAPASDVSSDATSSDATSTDSSDAGSSDAAADITDSGSCPGAQPADNSTCDQTMTCDYGDTQCACHVISAGVRKWACLGPDASPPTCPPNNMKPMSGDSCNDSGNTTFSCRYGTTWCFCNQADASDWRWDCL
jgi:hypothetical protein